MEPIKPESLGFIGGFGIAPPSEPLYHPSGSELITSDKQETKPEVKKDDKPIDKQEPKSDNKSLAEVLRVDREARAQKAKENQEAQSYKDQYEKLKTEFDSFKNAKAFEDDPVGYIKSRKLSPEMQVMLGETLLYDLAPDKAPPNLRFKLFEAKTQREKEQREQQLAEENAKRDRETAVRQIEAFANSLSEAARGFTAGSYPESEAWFVTETEEFDRDTYNRSLLATANNLALTATKQGRAADLSPANVAKTLEAEVARRMSARDKKRAVANTKPNTDNNGKQPVETLSNKGLNTGYEGPAKDEAERIRRAIAAGFGS